MSDDEKCATEKSKQIDRALRTESERTLREVKLLLLGLQHFKIFVMFANGDCLMKILAH